MRWTAMSGTDRWRLMTRGFVSWVVVGVVGIAAVATARKPTAALIAIVFLGLGFSLLVSFAIAAKARPGLFVPPHTEGLDEAQLRLVTGALRTGTPTGRPELARAVVGEARRRWYIATMLVGCWTTIVLIRVASFRSDPPFIRLLDVLLAVGVLACARTMTGTLRRERRAGSLTRAGCAQPDQR